MWEDLAVSDSARRACGLARQEGQRHNWWDIRSEHLLLGILEEPEGIGGRVLRGLGLRAESLRSGLHERLGSREPRIFFGQQPFSACAMAVLRQAHLIAKWLGCGLGTDCLALALLDQAPGDLLAMADPPFDRVEARRRLAEEHGREPVGVGSR